MAKRGRPRYPDILTPREWEVLALLRERLTNDGIAERLSITERTARYHVSEILGKLGLTSRDEAAVWQPEERPWWLGAALPFAFFWKKVSLGWLSPATTAVLGVVVATGIGLLVLGLVRTGSGSADRMLVAPATTPEPPSQLLWVGEEHDGFRMFSVHPGTCGDTVTAEAYDVPMMLEYTRPGPLSSPSRLLFGLEAEPYEYVPAQVRLWGPYAVSPEGWELSQTARFIGSLPSGSVYTEFFVRRLDQSARLFRYSAYLCGQEDGSQAELPERSPDRTIELSQDLPRTVIHKQGSFLTQEEAIEIAMEHQASGVRPVWLELGDSADFASTSGDLGFPPHLSDPDAVVWAVLFALGDRSGPQRSGRELGTYVVLDASTGDFLTWACCLELITAP